MNYNYKFQDRVLYGNSENIELYNDIGLKIENMENIPTEKKIDLSCYINDIYDQQNLGVSASHAICDAIKLKISFTNHQKFWFNKSFYNQHFIPSRLYIHNLAKLLEQKSLNNKDDPFILSCLKALSKYGICEESKFDYNISNLSKIPKLECFTSSIKYNFRFKKLYLDLNTFKICIKSANPIIMGVSIFSNSNLSGLFVKPDNKKDTYLGNHVILIIGYDDSKQTFKFVNCWNKNWGFEGKGFIMYDYALDENYVGDVYTLI